MTEEEEIIQKGLKSHDKKDTYCYIGIAILAILIILPPAFRVIFASSKPKDTMQEVVYLDLQCSHSYFDNEGHVATNYIDGNFRDNKVLKLTITFSYSGVDKVNKSDSQMSSLLDMVNSKIGVDYQEKGNTAIFTMDFLNKPDLAEKEELARYRKAAQAQLNEYKGLQYNCSYETNVKKEDVEKWNKEHNSN